MASGCSGPSNALDNLYGYPRTLSVIKTCTDPNALAVQALGDRLTPPVAKAVSRAETRKEAFALLVMSPEFQRR